MSILCMCVCVHQVYRIQPTNTGWQWTSGSRKETLWNMHEEIYTCFQVTKAGILKRDAVCVCVGVGTPAWAHAQTAQLPSFTCSDTLWGRKQLSTLLAWRDRHQSDQEKCCETVQPSVLKRFPVLLSYWELSAWKQVKVGPTETSLKLEVKTWWRVDQRGIKRSSQVLAWVLSIHWCKYESNVEGI